jgi:hypothetical protein
MVGQQEFVASLWLKSILIWHLEKFLKGKLDVACTSFG